MSETVNFLSRRSRNAFFVESLVFLSIARVEVVFFRLRRTEKKYIDNGHEKRILGLHGSHPRLRLGRQLHVDSDILYFRSHTPKCIVIPI